MTDHQAPERIWVDLQAVIADDEGHRVTYDSENIHHEYVPATALEAARARIAALEDSLNIERALSDGAHRRAKAARAKHYTECAAIADDWYHRSGHGSPGDDIRAKIDGKERGDG